MYHSSAAGETKDRGHSASGADKHRKDGPDRRNADHEDQNRGDRKDQTAHIGIGRDSREIDIRTRALISHMQISAPIIARCVAGRNTDLFL